jgi:hypothetical protein
MNVVTLPRELVERLIKWRLCMSHNDSYFGEPAGELKRVTHEIERAASSAVVLDDDACHIDPLSSRVCERGTKSCDAHHGRAAAPQAGAGLTDGVRMLLTKAAHCLENFPDGRTDHARKAALVSDIKRALLSHPTGKAEDAQAETPKRELSTAEIEKGWRKTFSTDNPFCPCNLKTFTKAVRWAEFAMTAAQPESGGDRD